MSAIVRINKHGSKEYVVVLCPMGHLIEAREIDGSFAGSALEADLGEHSAGRGVARWDRMADKCDGAGHENRASMARGRS